MKSGCWQKDEYDSDCRLQAVLMTVYLSPPFLHSFSLGCNWLQRDRPREDVQGSGQTEYLFSTVRKRNLKRLVLVYACTTSLWKLISFRICLQPECGLSPRSTMEENRRKTKILSRILLEKEHFLRRSWKSIGCVLMLQKGQADRGEIQMDPQLLTSNINPLCLSSRQVCRTSSSIPTLEASQ